MGKRQKYGIAAGLLFAAVLFSRHMVHVIEDRRMPRYVFTYAENQVADYPTTQGAKYFSQLVYERTEGKVEIQIHPDSELGDEMSVIEQIEFGGIDFARVSLASLANIIPKLNVLQLPYLYKDASHMWRVLDGEIGNEFVDCFQNYNMVPLSWYDAGARSFYTRGKPIEKLEDIQGMCIRVAESNMMRDMVKALGAEPIPMAFDQVYSALEQGKIDGAENSWPSYEAMRHFETAKYYTVDAHTRVPEMQIISQSTWDKLPQEYQQIILECAKESAKYERRIWKQTERDSKWSVYAKGSEIIELTEEEKARFYEAVKPVYDKYCADYAEIVDKIKKMGDDK